MAPACGAAVAGAAAVCDTAAGADAVCDTAVGCTAAVCEGCRFAASDDH